MNVMKKYMFFLFTLLAVAVTACAGPLVDIDSIARKERVVLDASRHQGVINFERVAKSVKWIYLKATEGSTHVDPKFLEYARDAKAAEMKVGAYHYFSELSSAREQACHFISMLRQVDIDLIPVVDVEVLNIYSPDQLRDSVQVILDCLEDEFGCKPMIYSGEKFFTNNLQAFGDSYPLWIAKYNVKNKKAPNVGADIVLWQSSESGSINGVSTPISHSTFMGDHRPRDIKLPSKRKSSKDDGKEGSKSSKKKGKKSRKGSQANKQ